MTDTERPTRPTLAPKEFVWIEDEPEPEIHAVLSSTLQRLATLLALPTVPALRLVTPASRCDDGLVPTKHGDLRQSSGSAVPFAYRGRVLSSRALKECTEKSQTTPGSVVFLLDVNFGPPELALYGAQIAVHLVQQGVPPEAIFLLTNNVGDALLWFVRFRAKLLAGKSNGVEHLRTVVRPWNTEFGKDAVVVEGGSAAFAELLAAHLESLPKIAEDPVTSAHVARTRKGLPHQARGSASPTATANLVATSPKFRETIRRVEDFAKLSSPVFIYGESGTGKESLARLVHAESPRSSGPFVAFAAGSVPAHGSLYGYLFGWEKGAFTGATSAYPGKLRQADGGTLFIDEVADMDSEMQDALIRFFEEGIIQPLGTKTTHTVNVRLVSATNRDLLELIGERKFREDLYYRLVLLQIDVPALRDRVEDIVPIAEHFLKTDSDMRQLAGGRRFSQPALAELTRTPFGRGNVRELQQLLINAAYRAADEGADLIDAKHIDTAIRRSHRADDFARPTEYQAVADAPVPVARASTGRTVSWSTLYERLRQMPSGFKQDRRRFTWLLQRIVNGDVSDVERAWLSDFVCRLAVSGPAIGKAAGSLSERRLVGFLIGSLDQYTRTGPGFLRNTCGFTDADIDKAVRVAEGKADQTVAVTWGRLAEREVEQYSRFIDDVMTAYLEAKQDDDTN